MTSLLLGPVLRHVGETTATIWVQTDRRCTVAVLGHSARTFTVLDQHFALVEVTGLERGSTTEYRVHLDGEQVWPPAGSAWPASRIRTRGGSGPVRVVFGSCRRAGPDDSRAPRALGPDALDAYASRMARLPVGVWPDALLLLGDQIYADDPSPRARRWLAARREISRPPGDEVADFTEYGYLYTESWSGGPLRWLLSTVPTAMIFDDHDVRDDWNTSRAWRDRIAAQTWWAGRVRGAFASYWVFQHAGNLDPDTRAADPVYRQVLGCDGDAWPVLERMAVRADTDPASVRWSYRWDIGSVRLVVIDTRAGRVLDEGARAMLDNAEFAWVEQAIGEDSERVDHVLIGSSLPWLLAPSISNIESANEAACRRGGHLAEWLRQNADLEHWAAFRGSFDRLAQLLRRVAQQDPSPATVCVLSGDVHHNYVARARFRPPTRGQVFQLVCSPIHHGLPWPMRVALRVAWLRPLDMVTRRLARSAGVADSEVTWSRLAGPSFDNALCTLLLDGRRAELTAEATAVTEGASRLSTMFRFPLTPADHEPGTAAWEPGDRTRAGRSGR